MSNPILDPTDAAYLSSRNLLTSPQQGKQSIRESLFVSESIPDTNLGDFIEIPTHLHSLETLEYIGYNLETAKSLWQTWTSLYDKGKFINFATSYVKLNKIADTSENDNAEWFSVMSACGINEDIQGRLMHPEDEWVRLTASVKYWVVDTLEIRFGALEEVQKYSKARAQRSKAVVQDS